MGFFIEIKGYVMDLPTIEKMCKEMGLTLVSVSAGGFNMKPIKFTKKEVPENGELMTIMEFVDCCKNGSLIDYDGYGEYATATMVSKIKVYPSYWKQGKLRTEFTHVLWYNR